jgi:hypothetical protein
MNTPTLLHGSATGGLLFAAVVTATDGHPFVAAYLCALFALMFVNGIQNLRKESA